MGRSRVKCSYHTHTQKGHKETFGADGYVYCLHCGNGFTGVYMSPNSSNYKIKYL